LVHSVGNGARRILPCVSDPAVNQGLAA
jgi:hypothetical protein